VSLAELDPAGRCLGRRGDRRGRCGRRRRRRCNWYHRRCHRRPRRRRCCHCRRRCRCHCRRHRHRRRRWRRQRNRRNYRRRRRRCHYCRRIYRRRYSGTRRVRSVNTHYRRLTREGGGRSPPLVSPPLPLPSSSPPVALHSHPPSPPKSAAVTTVVGLSFTVANRAAVAAEKGCRLARLTYHIRVHPRSRLSPALHRTHPPDGKLNTAVAEWRSSRITR